MPSNTSVAAPQATPNSVVVPSFPFVSQVPPSLPKVELFFDPLNSKNLIAALIRAKQKFAPIVKTKSVQNRGKYAPLPEVLDAIEPALLTESILTTQPLEIHEGIQTLATYLIHESGEVMKSLIMLPVPDQWQQFGMAISYARRYSLLAILNLAADDDDANSAPPINQGRTTGRPPVNRESEPGRYQAPPENGKKVQVLPGKLSADQQRLLSDALQKTGYSKEARKLLLVNNGGYNHPRDIPNNPETWERFYEMACNPKTAAIYNRQATEEAQAQTSTQKDDPLDEIADVPL